MKTMSRTKPRVFVGAVLLLAAFTGASLCAASFDKAAVAASTPEAVEAGLSILRSGGNAMDAAAAVAFALMVTDPAMCSLGGRSQILIYLSDGKLAGLDGATIAPGLADEPAKIGRGYRTCAVPGSPAALEQMVVRYGKLPLRVVMGPAIALARNGFMVNDQYHRLFQANQKVFRQYPGSAAHFLKPDGSPYVKGDRFTQPALARALELVAAEGSGVVYRGKIGQAIVGDMERNGGLITEQDLARYRVLSGKLVEGSYRGHRIVSRGDQCDGASVIEMLQILERFPLSSLDAHDPAYLSLLAQAVYLGFEDEELADWKQVSKPFAERRAREIDPNKAPPVPTRPRPAADDGETTHLSVVDDNGNAVAMTLSIGPTFGTKVANPEFGFLYGYSYVMNDDPAPYKRDKTSQSPTIVFQEGKPFLVIGSAGSSRIPSSIVQVLVNVIDHRMPLDKALASPRVFLTETELRLETPGIPGAVLKKLTEMGYRTTVYEDLNGYFGKVHAIMIDPQTRKLYAGFDPRGLGGASGL